MLFLIFLISLQVASINTATNERILTNIISLIANGVEFEQAPTVIDYNSDDIFLIEAEPADHQPIDVLAAEHGFHILKRLHSFPNVFVAKKAYRPRRSVNYPRSDQLPSKIKWSEHVRPLVRDKRLSPGPDKPVNISETLQNIEKLHHKGNTGKGIVVAILDDGVDYSHPALSASYRADLSFDFTHDKIDAMPENDDDNHHGTNCAGIIAMSASSVCGTGAAYGSQIAGLKMLGGVSTINDIMEGEALFHKYEDIDIYSVSWGPKDDGRSMEGPHRLARMALAKGSKMGRAGRGSIYVWASGNGGLEYDDCSMDGYASNIHTLTFGISDKDGNPTWYAEGCPAIIASVFTGSGKGFPTTDVNGACTHFTGSSAAAPLASSVLALVLEANPNLSQRDIQYLIVYTSNYEKMVAKNPDLWQINAAGLHVSRLFGFGSLDANKLVKNAVVWKTVEPESMCSKELKLSNKFFTNDSAAIIEIPFAGCVNTSAEINFIEKIELSISIKHPRRGDIVIDLESPSGTKIRLLRQRLYDDSEFGILNWPFVATHFWGENPQGTWKLHVMDKGKEGGDVHHLNLRVIGTKTNVMKNVKILY